MAGQGIEHTMTESKDRVRMWQAEWPAEEGAWWFCGRLPNETGRALGL